MNTPPNKFKPRAMQAALHALSLDKTLPEAHTVFASILGNYYWDWDESEREFKTAIALDPEYSTAHKWYAELLLCTGRFENASAEIEIARKLDPTSVIINQSVADPLFYSRKYNRAMELLHHVLAMNPNFQPTHYLMAEVYEQEQKTKEAIAEYEKALRLSTSAPAYILGPYGRALAKHGDIEKAGIILKQMQESAKIGYVDSWYFALVYIGLGDKEHAFTALVQALEDHSSGISHLKVDPSLDPLRDDPKYGKLMEKIGLPVK